MEIRTPLVPGFGVVTPALGVGATLLNVMVRGLNEQEIGGVIQLAKTHSVVRSVTVQTMTLTGQGGKDFQPRQTMTLDGAAKAIESATNGEMQLKHFFAHAGAHPLCYSVAYYLKGKDKYYSFTDFFTTEELRLLFGNGYLLQPHGNTQQLFRSAIDHLWASGDPANLLPHFKRLVESM